MHDPRWALEDEVRVQSSQLFQRAIERAGQILTRPRRTIDGICREQRRDLCIRRRGEQAADESRRVVGADGIQTAFIRIRTAQDRHACEFPRMRSRRVEAVRARRVRVCDVVD